MYIMYMYLGMILNVQGCTCVSLSMIPMQKGYDGLYEVSTFTKLKSKFPI